MASSFGKTLLIWHESIDRELPWKSTNDPYKIWLSEIILQQTRVEQGTPYYLKFIDLFPTVNDLANATEEQVLLAWQGLGYYSRARNLHFAAKTIVELHDGIFPIKYENIRALKGVGDYTAAAIASFAYGLPYPVLDGNVKRVMSRYFGISDPIDQSQTIKDLKLKLDKVFLPNKPAAFNQAIMDFGALYCTPKNPSCVSCPFSDVCVAYDQDLVSFIPTKSKKITKTTRYFNYFIVSDGINTVISKRINKDIWQGLFDFPLIEMMTDLHPLKTKIDDLVKSILPKLSDQYVIKSTYRLDKHILSHQNIYVTIHKVKLVSKIDQIGSDFQLMNNKNKRKFAFPVILSKHIDSIIDN